MKAVVIMSGGLDSTVLLNYVKSLGYDIYGLSFDYGQRHKKELSFAKYWASKLCRQWKLIDLNFMRDIASNSALTDYNMKLPLEHYTNENQKVTVVPNRNMVMLSIAVAWAENIDADAVFYGAHANDRSVYPDCREEFVNFLSKATEEGTYNRVRIEAPFVNLYKWQLVKLGSKLGVDFSKTWSCYEGKEKHCGRCATCQERKEAFEIADVKDPTEYEN